MSDRHEDRMLDCLCRIATALERQLDIGREDDLRRAKRDPKWWAEMICDRRGTTLTALSSAGRRLDHVFTRELIAYKLKGEGYTQHEIAATLGMHYSSVHHMWRRIGDRHEQWNQENNTQ